MERMMDISKLKDCKLKCCDCGDAFTWTVGEQAFWLSKGLIPPKRCPICRARRKATIVREVAR